MRHSMIGAVAAGVMLAAELFTPSGALAAPTCDNRNGETVRCGTPGAMPVGWAPAPGDIVEHSPAPPDLSPAESVALIYILIAFFALLALMPEFDGWREGDWDEQEGDKPKRRK